MGRFYNRLNQDYEPMHGLCWFFLENIGPTHEQGEHTILPFLVDKGRIQSSWLLDIDDPDNMLKLLFPKNKLPS